LESARKAILALGLANLLGAADLGQWATLALSAIYFQPAGKGGSMTSLIACDIAW
jgi:hypothetical protein